MTATLLDGKSLAQKLRLELAEQVAEFIVNNATTPTLAALLVGEDPASQVYVRNKERACEHVGIESQMIRLPAAISQDELMQAVSKLNKDDAVHGILVQLPLPAHIDTTRVLDAIDPLKDVDCFHPDNVGRLSQGRPRFLPCTPHGIVVLLHRNGIELEGKHVVIVGRSDIVGKPLAAMLAQRDSPYGPKSANATVTLCHSRSDDLAAITREADILIVATGQPQMITADMIRPGATVVDVGINRVEEGLVGDVDFKSACEVAGAITPVPGGVGPLTVAMLLYNTIAAAGMRV